MPIDLGATLQNLMNMYRSRVPGMSTEVFQDRVTQAYRDAGWGVTDARDLAARYLKYARTGQSINAPPMTPFDNPWREDEVLAQPEATGISAKAPINEEMLAGLPTFLQSLRTKNVPQGGPFGAWARGQYQPALESFVGRAAATGGIDPRPKEGGAFEEQPFANYLQQMNPGSMMGSTARYGQSANTSFQDIMRAMNTRDVFPMTAFQRQYGMPETSAEFGQGAGLGRLASTGRMGGLAAQYLMPSEADLYQRFLGGPNADDVSQWLPFLKQQLGLKG